MARKRVIPFVKPSNTNKYADPLYANDDILLKGLEIFEGYRSRYKLPPGQAYFLQGETDNFDLWLKCKGQFYLFTYDPDMESKFYLIQANRLLPHIKMSLEEFVQKKLEGSIFQLRAWDEPDPWAEDIPVGYFKRGKGQGHRRWY